MNVDLPFQHNPMVFWMILGVSAITGGIGALLLRLR